MSSPDLTQADRDATRAWLDSLGPDGACQAIEDCIGSAIGSGDLEAVPGLLVLMCRYDPMRSYQMAIERGHTRR
jgi:hypothetical protein